MIGVGVLPGNVPCRAVVVDGTVGLRTRDLNEPTGSLAKCRSLGIISGDARAGGRMLEVELLKSMGASVGE